MTSTNTYSHKAAIEDGAFYDPAEPNKVKAFISDTMIVPDGFAAGARMPILSLWEEIIDSMYGWRTKEGLQLFSDGSVWVGKKQSKTSCLSALSIWECVKQPKANIYILSSTEESARTLFDFAVSIINCSPKLRPHFETRERGFIRYPRNESIIRVVSGSPRGKSGKNATAVFVDEISDIKDRRAYDAYVAAGMSRSNSFMLKISHARYDRHSLGFAEYERAKSILDNTRIDPHYFPLIYEVPFGDEDDPEKYWEHLPSIDITVKKEWYRQRYQQVKDSPHDFAIFRTECLNQWVEHLDQWILPRKWKEGTVCPYPKDSLDGRECYLGIDPAKSDLAAYCLLFPMDDGKLFLLPRFFMPERIAKKQEQGADQIPWNQWGRQGDVVLTPGNVFDPATMRDWIVKDSKQYKFKEIGYDDFGFEDSRQLLEKELRKTLIAVPPWYSHVGDATVEFERLVIGNKLLHPQNDVLDWNARNAVVRRDRRDRLLIDRDKSNGRYDGLSAAIIALSRFMARPMKSYNYRGILTAKV